MANTVFLALKNITKSFPGVLALDRVSFEARRGEVHALCGENGAGKSTLMKIINGIHKADSGEIFIEGKSAHIQNPADARAKGIAMIFQECAFVPEMSVAESLFLGDLPVGRIGFFPRIDWKKIHATTEALLKEEGMLHNPRLFDGIHTKLKYLTIADIQMLEIVKAISKDSQVIIMDEPTSSIAKKEADDLLRKVVELRNRGKSIIYISHKMDEIFTIADRVTVFRDGRVVGGDEARNLTINKVITMMVGREVSGEYPKEEVALGDTILEVRDLKSAGVFTGINFTVRAGEIVGFAGLVGAGRTEVARGVSGLDPVSGGEVLVKNRRINMKNVSECINGGIAYCSEDRRRYGLVLIRGVRENVGLPNLLRYIYKGYLHKTKEVEEVDGQKCALRLKTPSLETAVATLSGGNQQKVVLAKWLIKDPDVLILDEPTRGIDVGAKYEIYKLMSEIVRNGRRGILMISSELPELLGMCDRIYVMAKGRIAAEIARKDFSQELIMQYATGSLRADAGGGEKEEKETDRQHEK
ncbi:MAG: sugar ABC transporter ATP-binding protein [Spirochaetaceae bacterium]|jgi:inositol transport system ATP-binding protein|nr:sugar ABC transporter ATP-binding protein [Spirochaetaceae bacterium]